MRCNNCGASFDGKSAICPYCGAGNSNGSVNKTSYDNEPSLLKKLVFCILGHLATIAAIICAGIFVFVCTSEDSLPVIVSGVFGILFATLACWILKKSGISKNFFIIEGAMAIVIGLLVSISSFSGSVGLFGLNLGVGVILIIFGIGLIATVTGFIEYVFTYLN